jgi:hypothetical protein
LHTCTWVIGPPATWTCSGTGSTSSDTSRLRVTARLVAGDLRVERLQSGVTFCRLQVSDSHEVLPIDLPADPVPTVVEPIEVAHGFLVDAPREILVNKLTALLSRWAVRDLVDVRALVASGEDLDRALRDSPAKDGGFSPQTLAWVLDTLPTNELDPTLRSLRDELAVRLLR